MSRLNTGGTVVTFGTFDLLHVGHIRLLHRARSFGDRLVVGVSSDELNMQKKGRSPVFSLGERMEILSMLKDVDRVFVEESLELKREYLVREGADIFVIGDDWQGKFDDLNDVCEVRYLERTPSISTTGLIEHVVSSAVPPPGRDAILEPH